MKKLDTVKKYIILNVGSTEIYEFQVIFLIL